MSMNHQRAWVPQLGMVVEFQLDWYWCINWQWSGNGPSTDNGSPAGVETSTGNHFLYTESVVDAWARGGETGSTRHHVNGCACTWNTATRRAIRRIMVHLLIQLA